MKSFKQFISKSNDFILEGFEQTSLFSILSKYEKPHKIFESLMEEDYEFDVGEYLYNEYLNLLDESYMSEDALSKLMAQASKNNKERQKQIQQRKQQSKTQAPTGNLDRYQQIRRQAIDNNRVYNDYYRDRSGKPMDGQESRQNRNANLTELLPCIWYKMNDGKPFVKSNGKVVDDINSIQNAPRLNDLQALDTSAIKRLMIMTLDYVKKHENELKDIVSYGNDRYKMNIVGYNGKDVDNEGNKLNTPSLYLALKQDLLLSLDVNDKLDFPYINGTDKANVIKRQITFQDENGKKIDKSFINRPLENLFSMSDLLHNNRNDVISKIKQMTLTVRNKCMQAFNIYNYMTANTFNQETMEKLGVKDPSEITLYWTCSNENKGDFDVDYSTTTSDVIASSASGKSIGISLKADTKSENFNAKNYNMQSLLLNLMDFNKEQVDSLIEKMMHALWNIAGYRNLINEGGIDKISEDTFVKFKKRILMSDNKTVAYEYIDKWNAMFNNAIFKPIMQEMEEYFKEMMKHRPEDMTFEEAITNKLAEKIEARCRYIYNHCYVGIYHDYMEKVCEIYSEFFENEWNKSFKDKKKKFIMNMFGEYEDKDVRVIVGANDYKKTVDATNYNEKLLSQIMSNEDCYPIFKLNENILNVSFNGLPNSYNIQIRLETFDPDINKQFDNESSKSYYFAIKDYLENYIEKLTYNRVDPKTLRDIPTQRFNNDNYSYKVFKNILTNKDKNNKLHKTILTCIGKMNKVANFPFNSSASVVFDIKRFRNNIALDLNNKKDGN